MRIEIMSRLNCLRRSQNVYKYNVSIQSQSATSSKFLLSQFHYRSLYLMERIRSSFTTSVCARKNSLHDPRKNVQYPFVREDPLHSNMISGKESVMSFKERKWKREYQRQREHAAVSEMTKTKTFREAHNLDLDLDFRFESLDETDIATAKLGKLILGERHGRVRKKSQIVILEGTRLIKDALKAGAEARCLCFCQPDVLHHLGEAQGLLKNVKLYKISSSTMKTFSDTVTPGGLLGVFNKPDQGKAVCPPKDVLPINLIYDSLKDPGNAGTLIRTSAAIGCERIFATRGCVNLWERKVLRSAMGAHFNIPIYNCVDWKEVGNYLGPETVVLLANNSTTAAQEEHAFGSSCDVDVVNLERQSLNHEQPEWVSVEQEDKVSPQSETDELHSLSLPAFDYSDIQLSSLVKNSVDRGDARVSIALVIGSEATGLSEQAKQFALDHNGAYITVPMNETTNSLNSAVAGSIILYELRKKMLTLSIT